MIEQQTLFPTIIRHPQPPALHFEIIVHGRKVSIKYQANYGGFTEELNSKRPPYAVQHVEFRTDSPGPISETGYRSHFVSGTREQLGLTDKNVRTEIQRLAEDLANIYEKEAPERREKDRFLKKHGLS
jgi:hypothetical protein